MSTRSSLRVLVSFGASPAGPAPSPTALTIQVWGEAGSGTPTPSPLAPLARKYVNMYIGLGTLLIIILLIAVLT